MEPRGHLSLLDGVRFACASIVLAYHFLFVFPLAAESAVDLFDPRLTLPSALGGFAWWGWVGVELFFVVSGYVIAASVGDTGPGGFVRRRALRLLPGAWVCASLTALALLVGSAVATPTIAARWLNSMLVAPLGEPIDGVYWTLGVEVVFYALVAGLVRAGADNAARLARLGLALAVLSGGFWLWQWFGPAPFDATGRLVRLSLAPHGGCFAIGIVLQAAAARGWRPVGVMTAMLGLAAAGAEIVSFTREVGVVPEIVADPAVPLAVFALGVVAIETAHRLGSPARGAGVLAMLGRATYPLYLLNQVVGAAVIVALTRSGLTGWTAVGVAAGVVLMAAVVIATYVEPWVRTWLGKRLSRAAPSDAAEPRLMARSTALAGLGE